MPPAQPSHQPSPEQERVFAQTSGASNALPAWQVGDRWVDLYAILEVAPTASELELEDAIISRGADCVCFAFARSGKPGLITLIEAHLHEFRPVLLDYQTRRRYDALLARHRAGDESAQSYAEFLQTLPPPRGSSSGCLTALLPIFLFGGATLLRHLLGRGG